MTEPVFFPSARTWSLEELAAASNSELRLNGASVDRVIASVAQAKDAGAVQLAFVEGKSNKGLLAQLRAGLVLLTDDMSGDVPSGVAILVNGRPYQAFARLARMMHASAVHLAPMTGENGISSRAFVHSSVKMEAGVIIEAGAVVSANVAIGEGTVIGPNAVIGPACQIGRDCRIGANVTIQAALIGNHVILHPGCQIGQDGFGFVPGAAGLEKVPQIGRVIIQDDVEIGANSTVDRGALGDTVVGGGTKIDNLVQIGHNVRIGQSCAIAAHTGISGSATIGNYVMLGGRVGIADHITLGDGVQVAATSGVMNDIPAGEKWAGTPAMPVKGFFRQLASLRALSESTRKKDGKDG